MNRTYGPRIRLLLILLHLTETEVSLLHPLLSKSSLPLRLFAWTMSSSIPLGQCAASYPNYSGENNRKADRLSQRTAFQVPHPDELLMFKFGRFFRFPRTCRIRLHPFATIGAFGFSVGPCELGRCSSRFSPPDGYPLYQAGTSSLLRIHLGPHTASIHIESPLEFHYPLRTHRAERYEASPVTDGLLYELPHYPTRHGSEEVLGVALFSTLTHPHLRIRFA